MNGPARTAHVAADRSAQTSIKTKAAKRRRTESQITHHRSHHAEGKTGKISSADVFSHRTGEYDARPTPDAAGTHISATCYVGTDGQKTIVLGRPRCLSSGHGAGCTEAARVPSRSRTASVKRVERKTTRRRAGGCEIRRYIRRTDVDGPRRTHTAAVRERTQYACRYTIYVGIQCTRVYACACSLTGGKYENINGNRPELSSTKKPNVFANVGREDSFLSSRAAVARKRRGKTLMHRRRRRRTFTYS